MRSCHGPCLLSSSKPGLLPLSRSYQIANAHDRLLWRLRHARLRGDSATLHVGSNPSKEAHSPLLLWLVATLQTSTPTRTVRRIWGSAVAQLQVWEAARSSVYCVRGGPLCHWYLMLCSSLFPDLAWVHVVDRTLTRVSGPCGGPKFNTLIHHENFLLKQI